MKRVECLYRVSTEKQIYDDDIPMQKNECRRFIAERSDWRLCREHVEKAVSGYKNSVADRDELIEIMQRAEAKEFDVLLVYMSDRIGRREDETPLYVAKLNETGVEVWSVHEGQLKTEEHIDKLMNYIRFWQAEGESRKTAARVRDAQINMIKQGKFAGGGCAFGYELNFTGEINSKGKAVRRLAVKEDEAAVVRKIFMYAAEWEWGYRKISNYLNEEKVPSAKGLEWRSSSIANILKNPIYKGYMAYGKFYNNGKNGRQPETSWILSEERNDELAIVSVETWESVQKLIKSRTVCRGGNKKYKTPCKSLLLSGILYCGYCGKALLNGSSYYYWKTADGNKHKRMTAKYRCSNDKKYYYAKDIEDIVVREVISYLNTINIKEIEAVILECSRLAEDEKKQKLKKLSLQLDKINKDLKILDRELMLSLKGESALTKERIINMIKLKETEMENMKTGLKKLSNFVFQLNDFSGWETEFGKLNTEVQRLIISKYILRVDISDKNIAIRTKCVR